MNGLLGFSKSFSFGAASAPGLCGFGARRVAETGKVAGLAQSHAVLSSVRSRFLRAVAILRDPQLSSCISRSVSLKSRAGFVEFLPRFDSSGLFSGARRVLARLRRVCEVVVFSSVRRTVVEMETASGAGARCSDCRNRRATQHFRGTPQLYLLSVVSG